MSHIWHINPYFSNRNSAEALTILVSVMSLKYSHVSHLRCIWSYFYSRTLLRTNWVQNRHQANILSETDRLNKKLIKYNPYQISWFTEHDFWPSNRSLVQQALRLWLFWTHWIIDRRGKPTSTKSKERPVDADTGGGEQQIQAHLGKTPADLIRNIQLGCRAEAGRQADVH